MEKGESKQESYSNDLQFSSRSKLMQMYENTPMDDEELMSCFGLYTRASVLVKYLVINDLYKRILNIPGVVVEFGTRFGQNMILFENLRAIYEPFNKTRQIIGFDTFDGYQGFTENDTQNEIFNQGQYKAGSNYKEHLIELLKTHEQNNVLGHINGIHDVVEGDVSKTAKAYFDKRKELTVSLAYFDMGLYQPTKDALLAIKDRLVKGSVILLDEFTWQASPGEAIAFREVFPDIASYKIEKSEFTPMRAIITIL